MNGGTAGNGHFTCRGISPTQTELPRSPQAAQRFPCHGAACGAALSLCPQTLENWVPDRPAPGTGSARQGTRPRSPRRSGQSRAGPRSLATDEPPPGSGASSRNEKRDEPVTAARGSAPPPETEPATAANSRCLSQNALRSLDGSGGGPLGCAAPPHPSRPAAPQSRFWAPGGCASLLSPLIRPQKSLYR